MVVGHDRDVVLGSERRRARPRHRLAQPESRAREALRGEPVAALVHHRDLEPAAPGEQRERLRDVAGAEHDQARCGGHHLEEHRHLAAAAHAQLLGEVAAQRGGLAARQQLARLGDHLELDRPAADGAGGGAVRGDQHARPRLAGREPAALGHRGEHEAPSLGAPALERLPHLGVGGRPRGSEPVGRALVHDAAPRASRSARRTNTGTIACR